MDSNQLPVKFLKLTFIQLNYIDCVLLQVILSGDEDVIFFFFHSANSFCCWIYIQIGVLIFSL